MAVTLNIPNAYDDNSAWDSENSWWYLSIRCNDGYVFKGDVIATYTDTDGYPATKTLTKNGANVWAWSKITGTDANTKFTVTGATRDENSLDIANNVPNTTVNGTATTMGAQITLTAEDGYKITAASVTYATQGYGDMTDNMNISADGKTATWEDTDNYIDTAETVTINGTSAADVVQLTVVNNIQGTNMDESHNYDGNTATFTIIGKYNPSKTRFFDLKATYTNKAGNTETQAFTVTDKQYTQEATLSITDIDPTKTVTLTGEYTNVIPIDTTLSNCTANADLPQYIKDGESVTVTLTANEGTEFDATKSIPSFEYMTAEGTVQVEMTISSDKKTATGSVTPSNTLTLYIIGNAYPIAVVGEQYGAINVYLVTLDELAQFSAKRFFKSTGTDSQGNTTYENVDLGAFVNRIRRIYALIDASSSDVIRCGNYNTGVACQQPSVDKLTLDFGTATIPTHNDDNVDYESEVQLFLPFAGFVNLNKNYVGKTIGLQYIINVITGNGVALLSCDGVVFQTEEIEPSSEIIYLSPTTQVKTMGGDDWNEMLYYGIEPYIYCKWFSSMTQGRNNDFMRAKIGTFNGFNVFDDVTPIYTAEMLSREQEMIYQTLADGVYID